MYQDDRRFTGNVAFENCWISLPMD